MAHLPPNEILSRAREFQECADFAGQNKFFNACAICSYAALFWAARAALAYEGYDQSKWQHHELQTKFIQELIEKRSRYSQKLGKWLVNAYALRNAAQYHAIPPEIKKVRRMIYHAKEFIQNIAEVIKI